MNTPSPSPYNSAAANSTGSAAANPITTNAMVKSTPAPASNPTTPKRARNGPSRKAVNVDVMAGIAITSPRCPALIPNSDSRCTGRAVRNKPKISMKMKNPMLTDPMTSRWRRAEPRRGAGLAG